MPEDLEKKTVSTEEQREIDFNNHRLKLSTQAVGFAGFYVAGLVGGFFFDNLSSKDLTADVVFNFLSMAAVSPLLGKLFYKDLSWKTALLESSAVASGYSLGIATNQLIRGKY